MADHPLRSATHRCLGRPLPHQLANGTRTHLYAIACKQRPPFLIKFIMSVFGISSRFQLYPHHRGRLSTCYSPVRHFTRDRSPFAYDLHVLSTPPAFNLSQNQTLQFKSVAKISVGRKSESQSSFPFAIHLSMNHTDSLGAK